MLYYFNAMDEKGRCIYCNKDRISPEGFVVNCCDQSVVHEQHMLDQKYIAHLESRGYEVKKKRVKQNCPYCNSNEKVITFDSDEDLCTKCHRTFPGS